MSTAVRGRWAERLAGAHLAAQGLEHVASNWRGSHGEIDIVMRDGGVLVFVEVRFRRGGLFGGGAESIGPRKRARLVDTAKRYLQRTRTPQDVPCRFDVVAVSGTVQRPVIDWIRDAFES